MQTLENGISDSSLPQHSIPSQEKCFTETYDVGIVLNQFKLSFKMEFYLKVYGFLLDVSISPMISVNIFENRVQIYVYVMCRMYMF